MRSSPATPAALSSRLPKPLASTRLGYKTQWGSTGRNDLGVIKNLGLEPMLGSEIGVAIDDKAAHVHKSSPKTTYI